MLDNLKRYIAIAGAVYIGVAVLVFGTVAYLAYKIIVTKQIGSTAALVRGR